MWNAIDRVSVLSQCQSVEFPGSVLSQCVTCITVRMEEAHRHGVLALVALHLDSQAKTLVYRQGTGLFMGLWTNME